MRIGELFAGYGGLGMGVQEVLGGEVAWFSEFDPAPSKILKHHWPDIPNLGDITKIDWLTVPPVDILTGGFPCQDVSLAGTRAGLKDGTRSGLWSEFARAIEALQPRMVVIENVRGLLSASAGGSVEPDPWGLGDGATRPVINALGAVLGDLVSLGYDARWCGVRAADAGAPHGRFRVFILAYAKSLGRHDGHAINIRPTRGRVNVSEHAGDATGGTSRTSTADAHATHNGHERARGTRNRRAGLAHDDLVASDPGGERLRQHTGEPSAEETRPRSGDVVDGARRPRLDTDWGPYRPAIERWEHITGLLAPPPTNADGKNGQHRLSARFVEWMMGLPEGHVTDTGLTRNEQLKALGNGVVPQQAALALRLLLKEG